MVNKNFSDGPYTFFHPPCIQQNENNLPQQYLTNNMTVPSYANQSQNMYDYMYGQLQQRSSNVYNGTTSFYSDNLVESQMVADYNKTLKFTDKVDALEISPKDLSPSCSNITELLFPDIDKNVNKENKLTGQCLYSPRLNQKVSELPSCSQLYFEDNSSTVDKLMKYCTIPKVNEIDFMGSCIGNNTNELFGQYMETYDKNIKIYNSSDVNQANYKYYSHSENLSNINPNEVSSMPACFLENQNICPENPLFVGINTLDQRIEDSNEESDIIVEESEEEITDYSEDIERQFHSTSSCIVCNVVYVPIGNQFYLLTDSMPLTMSSQKPVHNKLLEIVGDLENKQSYLCNSCLGLINTIDNLQVNLENLKCELLKKVNDTRKTLNISSSASQSFKKQKKKNSFICQHTFNCNYCKKVYNVKSIYKRHVSMHKSKCRYLCEQCGQKFSKLHHLKVHRKQHLQKSVQRIYKIKAFVCKVCSKPFRTRTNLKEHECYCSGKFPYDCRHMGCDKKFATSSKLKNHIKLKHDKKFSSICSICNIGFVKTSDYKSHMVSHSTDKKFNCTKCDKNYKTLSNLNFHMKFHSHRLPFECPICNKGFMRKEYLDSHINKHNGIKNYACTFCDKKFVSQKNLDAHIKYHDGTVVKKSCNICGKIMATGIEEHIRTHNDLKEFQCEFCEIKFNTKGALAKHKKRKHVQSNEGS